MKKSVLEYVQACLSKMDSDNVDSITDTEEATQVADLLADVYYEFVTRDNWSFLDGGIVVQTLADPSRPTAVSIPAEVKRIDKVMYKTVNGTVTRYKELKYLRPNEWLDRFTVSGDSRVLSVVNSLSFYVETDRDPAYWTSFDDSTIVVDAWKQADSTTVLAADFNITGSTIPEFEVSDDFVPVLPDLAVPYIQNSLNAAAMQSFKQQGSVDDETKLRRQYAMLQRRDAVTRKETYYEAKYGRR